MAQDEARKYANEIAPAFNAYMYFRIGYWISKKLARLVYRMRVGFFDNHELSKVDPESAVVFVMNHRSNMDYVLVSFLVAEKTALSYAVGEWARIWPLQTLLKSMGAFFVRRNSGNPLYRPGRITISPIRIRRYLKNRIFILRDAGPAQVKAPARFPRVAIICPPPDSRQNLNLLTNFAINGMPILGQSL